MAGVPPTHEHDLLPTRSRVRSSEILSEQELLDIERSAPNGLTSRQIVEVFQGKGVKFSEATLRKYVQLNLLPKSTRVGQKGGRHLGSHGIYPCNVVRRINTVKALLAENLTIQEIQKSFVNFKDEIDGIEKSVRSLFSDLEREGSTLDEDRRKEFEAEILDAKRAAGELVRRISRLESRLSNRGAGGSGAVVGGGHDLY
jgi:DNA-binding transcriptional MerR regulator